MRAKMAIVIRWKNNAHGDAENIFGSIADALFSQDKWLDGSFEGKVSDDGAGYVDVCITFDGQE